MRRAKPDPTIVVLTIAISISHEGAIIHNYQAEDPRRILGFDPTRDIVINGVAVDSRLPQNAQQLANVLKTLKTALLPGQVVVIRLRPTRLEAIIGILAFLGDPKLIPFGIVDLHCPKSGYDRAFVHAGQMATEVAAPDNTLSGNVDDMIRNRIDTLSNTYKYGSSGKVFRHFNLIGSQKALNLAAQRKAYRSGITIFRWIPAPILLFMLAIVGAMIKSSWQGSNQPSITARTPIAIAAVAPTSPTVTARKTKISSRHRKVKKGNKGQKPASQKPKQPQNLALKAWNGTMDFLEGVLAAGDRHSHPK